jgi:hypothetical protein
MSMRVRLAGHKMLFNPAAVVDHVGAPQASGRRFDWRYAMFGQRNHIVLLIRNFGLASKYPWRHLLHSAWRDAKGFLRRMLNREFKMAFSIAFGTAVGTLLGWPGGILRLVKDGRNPVRNDEQGKSITAALALQRNADVPSAIRHAGVQTTQDLSGAELLGAGTPSVDRAATLTKGGETPALL